MFAPHVRCTGTVVAANKDDAKTYTLSTEDSLHGNAGDCDEAGAQTAMVFAIEVLNSLKVESCHREQMLVVQEGGLRLFG